MTETEAISLITSGPQGVAEWNRLRSSGAELPLQLYLYNTDLPEGTDLQGIDLGGCCLQGSELWGINLSRAHLYRTDFGKCDISSVNFEGACLDQASFTGATLHQVNFDSADLKQASFATVRGSADFAHARLERADFGGAQLQRCDFSRAQLADSSFAGASLQSSNFVSTNLQRADFSGAQAGVPTGENRHRHYCRFDQADLQDAVCAGADLGGASFVGANLEHADLQGTNLRGASLDKARMIGARLQGADLTGSAVYGVSAWDLAVDDNTRQSDLHIGLQGENSISVDDLEVAQFMYLLLNNARLRNVIDTITSRVVLILGRFSAERKPVLDAVRDALRTKKFGYVPIIFDFDVPSSRSTMETITTLAGMSRFVVADLSDPACVFGELTQLVPSYPSLPVVPLLAEGQPIPGMWDFIDKYDWVLPINRYTDGAELVGRLDQIFAEAIAKTAPTDG